MLCRKKRTFFQEKAFAHISLNSPIKVVALNPNSYTVSAGEGQAELARSIYRRIAQSKGRLHTQASGQVPLTEAENRRQRRQRPERTRELGMVEELPNCWAQRQPAAVPWQTHTGALIMST